MTDEGVLVFDFRLFNRKKDKLYGRKPIKELFKKIDINNPLLNNFLKENNEKPPFKIDTKKTNIVVHVRRGDVTEINLEGEKVYTSKKSSSTKRYFPIKKYIKIVDKIIREKGEDNCNIFVFSDGNEKALKILKEKLPEEKYKKIIKMDLDKEFSVFNKYKNTQLFIGDNLDLFKKCFYALTKADILVCGHSCLIGTSKFFIDPSHKRIEIKVRKNFSEVKKYFSLTLSKILKKEGRPYRLFKFAFNYIFDKGKKPDFVVGGAQKGGTAFLDRNLRLHHQIEICPNLAEKKWNRINKKEAHFFDSEKKFRRGIRWYKSLFNDNDLIQGDVTPDYLHIKEGVNRIHKNLPNVKIIFILRNPVKRAYSHYSHYKDKGHEKLKKNLILPNGNFEENLDREIKEGFPERGLISKGFYGDQIEQVLSLFKREQVLILISEESRKDPLKTLNKICNFLGVKKLEKCFTEEASVRKYNQPMSKKTEKRLYEIYKPSNEKLFKLLGYRIGEWENY